MYFDRVSEVVVIDAKTMSPDPIAVVELPVRVPHCIHALFVSEVSRNFDTILLRDPI